MQNKKFFILRMVILAAGLSFLILPHFTKENETIYVLAPWIYLTCFLFYSRSMEKRWEWIIFSAVLLFGLEVRYRDFLGDSEIVLEIASVILLVVLTAGFIIPFVCDRICISRGGPFVFLMFPLMRVLIEHVIYGQQFNLSLTQFGNKWLIQSEALFGDNFVSFMVAFIPTVVTYMLVQRRKSVMIAGGISLSLCALVFVYGMVRYDNSRSFHKTVKMAYATGPQKTYYEDPAEEDPDYEENVSYLRRTVKEAAEGGAYLIAYAEEAFMAEGADEQDGLIDEARKCAAENHIAILLSIDFSDEDTLWENKAVLIDRDGAYLSDYTKTNLIPVVEDGDYQAGDGVIPCNHVELDGKEIPISYTICYDATFSDFLLTMDRETKLYINPSWDWAEIVDLNYRMQGISAIQGGVVLFKPTVDGWSTVMDPYGRLHYKFSTLGQDYDKVYFVDVPYGKARSLYKRLHEYIGVFWSGMILSALVYLGYVSATRIAGWVKNRRKKNKQQQ